MPFYCHGCKSLSDEATRLRAEVERFTRERDAAREEVQVVGKGLDRFAGVVSRIAGTLGLDPDQSEEEEVEQRARALRALLGQLVGVLRQVVNDQESKGYVRIQPVRTALAAAAPYLP